MRLRHMLAGDISRRGARGDPEVYACRAQEIGQWPDRQFRGFESRRAFSACPVVWIFQFEEAINVGSLKSGLRPGCCPSGSEGPRTAEMEPCPGTDTAEGRGSAGMYFPPPDPSAQDPGRF